MRKTIIVGLMCALCWCTRASAEDTAQRKFESQARGAQDWMVSTAVTYETGDFGTGVTTHTVYIPVTLQRNFAQGTLALTLPYIYQESGPNVRSFGGRPFQTGRFGFGGSESAGGVGDVILKGSYDLMTEAQQPFNLSAIGGIKFPTADDKKGLGTGEFDETIGLAASRDLDQHWFILGEVDYIFIGDPPGLDLKNQFVFLAGVGYQWSADTAATVSYEQRTALIGSRPDPRDLVFGIEHRLNESMSIFGNVGFGLSEGSPDSSVTAGASFWF